ncbi:MAG: circadian clock KaiB family protein [Marmoricola sp.]
MTTDDVGSRWTLTLYVSGASPRSAEAIVTVRRICDEDLAGRVDLTVLDAMDHPERVKQDHILALPTLVKHSPAPLRHLVGNLADVERVRRELGMDAATPPEPMTTAEAGEVR